MSWSGTESKCKPFPYSSDMWGEPTVAQLDRLVARQATLEESSAGLVIGSGGLIYLMGHLSLRTMTVADLHGSVIDSVFRRVQVLSHSDSWDDYQRGFQEGLSTYDRIRFRREHRIARNSGLMTDFRTTQEGLASTAIISQVGDIRETAQTIADDLARRDQVLTFMNLTNTVDYIRTGGFWHFRSQRMEVLGRALSTLPVIGETIIVDSSGYCFPSIYGPGEYPGLSETVTKT
jgi:hypothetical protein